MKPTNELYRSLEIAYQHFNNELFDNQLPSVLFTVQRQKGALGYFVPDRWTSLDGDYCHEIAINPAHMGSSRVIDVMQTLVHEMVHCWQFCYGTPSRSGYHNKEWAYKMMEIGLQPSTTGEPGGDIVGHHMSDYIIEDGGFKRSCFALIKNQEYKLPWIYRLTYTQPSSIPSSENEAPLETISIDNNPVIEYQSDDDNTQLNAEHFLFSTYKDLMPEETFYTPPVNNASKSKVKYQCPSCGLNAWSKQNVKLMCMDCELELQPR